MGNKVKSIVVNSFPERTNNVGFKEPVEILIYGTSTGSFYALSRTNSPFGTFDTCETMKDVTFFPASVTN